MSFLFVVLPLPTFLSLLFPFPLIGWRKLPVRCADPDSLLSAGACWSRLFVFCVVSYRVLSRVSLSVEPLRERVYLVTVTIWLVY